MATTEVTKRGRRDASPTAESLVNVENAFLADSDIYVSEEALFLRMDMPGVERGNVQIVVDEDNVLQVTGVTNPLGLGFDAMAMVGIRTSGPPEPVADAIAQWDEAGYVVVTAGQFDLLVELVCPDRHELLAMTNRIRSLPEVVSTETFLYLDLS